jgi:hypothetical protein
MLKSLSLIHSTERKIEERKEGRKERGKEGRRERGREGGRRLSSGPLGRKLLVHF